MALEQKLSLRLSQRLVMTPSLQQAIKLLQMTRLELEGVLTQELVDNPLLEETVEQREEEAEAEEAAEEKEAEDPFDEIDFEAFFGEYYEGSSHASIREDREEFRFETNLTREPDLYDHLTWQLHMTGCSPTRRRIGEIIIGNLNPEGFLIASRVELCQLAEDEMVPVEEALALAKAYGIDPGIELGDIDLNGLDLNDFDVSAGELASLPGVDYVTAKLAAQLITARGEQEAYDNGDLPTRPILLDSSSPLAVAGEGDDEGEELAASATEEENLDQLFPHTLVEEVDAALALVRSLEPPGVGWYSLRESLLAQLDRHTHDPEDDAYQLAGKMLSEDWELFLRRQFPALAKKYGVELHRLEPAVEKVRELETRPGRRFGSERARYIEPDVAVQKVGGEYVIQLNDDGLPRLRISRAYRQMLRKMKSEGNHSDAQSFIKDKMRSAMWLIKSLDQRQRTIYKVARSIVDQQKDFLDHGIEHLRPMVLRDVAEDIQMHESTVSRVVSNKYINTPRGLLPMKFFFHSGIDRDYGENISSLTVKRKLERLIAEEDAKKPLSDSELMRILKREGIQIARRTVAKYRDELGIPSSTERKQIF